MCSSCNLKKGGVKNTWAKKKNVNLEKKKQRALYLDDDTYNKAVQKGEFDDRSFTNYVEVLIKKDLESKNLDYDRTKI